MERIMKGVDAPIIPVHLDGVWGSMFSFERGRFFWETPAPRSVPRDVSFGKPLPPTATAVEVRQSVNNLRPKLSGIRSRAWKLCTTASSTRGADIPGASRWPMARLPNSLRRCSGQDDFPRASITKIMGSQKMVGLLLRRPSAERS